MTSFLDLASQQDHRVEHYAARLYRIEIHIRRQERRAARAQLQGMAQELQQLERDMELPTEFVLAGANLGLLSGKGSMVRGRLPAAAFGALAGWLFGQASTVDRRRLLRELLIQTLMLEDQLDALERELARQPPAPASA